MVPADNEIQEDTFIASWNGSASLVIEGPPADLQQQVSEDQVLQIIYRVISSDLSKASLLMGQGALDVTTKLNAQSAGAWQTARVRLSCFADLGTPMTAVTEPLVITAEGSMKLQITSAKLTTAGGTGDCEF